MVSTSRLVRVSYLMFRMYDNCIESGRLAFCPGCNGMVAASRRCEQWTCVGLGTFITEVPGFTFEICYTPWSYN